MYLGIQSSGKEYKQQKLEFTVGNVSSFKVLLDRSFCLRHDHQFRWNYSADQAGLVPTSSHHLQFHLLSKAYLHFKHTEKRKLALELRQSCNVTVITATLFSAQLHSL